MLFSAFKKVGNTHTQHIILLLYPALNGSIFFNANLADCMYTKRSTASEVFTQTYDFRLVGTPNDLGNQITY